MTLGNNNMNNTSSSSWVKRFGIVVCWVIGVFCCGYGAYFGAVISGMRDGPQGLGTILFFLSGCLVGAIVITVVFITLSTKGKSYASYGLSAIIVPVVAVIISAVVIPIMSYVDSKGSERRQEISEASKNKYDLLYLQIQKNPEIAIQENWGDGNYEHALVFEASWADDNVPYTLDQLKRIYAGNPRAYNIFHHPSCTTDFLASHFASAYDDAFSISQSKLTAIVSNPKTPRELILKVANSRELGVGCVYPARRTLEMLDKKQAQQGAASDR